MVLASILGKRLNQTGENIMKTFIAILITLSSVAAFAGEVESKCGQVSDGVDRTTTKTDAGSSSSSSSNGGASAQ